MTSIKTAISIDEPLFEQVKALAQQLHISRSRLFALALQDFLRRHENRILLEQLNTAYQDDSADAAERQVQRRMRRQQRKLVEGAW